MIHNHPSGEETIRALAPAKINLRLRVLARETTGYHQIETLFCRIGLADTLEVSRVGESIDLEVRGAALGRPEDNLAYRAATAYFEAARVEPGVRIRLEKAVPSGAGLGGGSSDAATVLLALNQLYDEVLSPATLFRIGARLGSDVTFFLSGAPWALAWGRGERLLPLPPLPVAPIVLVVPDSPVATPEAYRDLARSREGRELPPQPAIIDPERIKGWKEIASLASNDFEPPLFRRYPELRSIKVALQDAGATVSLLTGSGSSIFGVFPDEEVRERAVPHIRVAAPGCQIIETETALIA